jgi:hypothetical protein
MISSLDKERARRANAGLNFQTFSEVNDSTIPGDIELVRQRYFARRIHALGERALFVSELATGANLTCGDVNGIGRTPR